MSFITPGGLGQDFAGGLSAWSTTVNSGGIAYSNQNRSVLATSSTDASVEGSVFRSSGKRYFEIVCAALVPTGSYQAAGVVTNSWVPSAIFIGDDANSLGAVTRGAGVGLTSWSMAFNGTAPGSGITLAGNAGDVIGVAVDFGYSGGVGCYFSLNGTWFNSGTTAFPSTPDHAFPAATALATACTVSNAGTMTLNIGNAVFANTPPSGFGKWG